MRGIIKGGKMKDFNPFDNMFTNDETKNGYGDVIAGVVVPDEMEGTNSELKLVPLPWICVKKENNFGSNKNEMQVLINEIKQDGQRTPIKIYSIDGILALGILNDEDKAYYTKMKEKGCKYFVNEGHRRFKAVMSLAINEEIIYDDQTYDKYDKLIKEYEKYSEEQLSIKKSNPWIVIKAEICSDYENLEWGANDNLFQRNEIKEFEVYYNVIDLLKSNGTYKKAQDTAKTEYVKSMKDRAVIDHLNLLIKKGVIDRSEFDDCNKSIVKYRKLLEKQEFNNLPNRANLILINNLSKAIYERTGRDVSATWINYLDNIIETFDKRIIKEIINGNISISNARSLLPIYDKKLTSEKEILKLVNNARSGKFNINDYIEKKEKAKKGYKKKVTYSAKDVLMLLEEIIYKKTTLNDVYERIKKQV